ncbi:MAG: Ig-like domain-containing protein, partial [Acidimicrobiales bacterium]
MLVLTAFVTVATLAAAAFAVDLGRGVAYKRDLQGDADIAAIDAARALGNRKGEGGMALQVHAEKLAEESMARNNFDPDAAGNSWALRLGVVDPVTRTFSPTDPSLATAVEVALTGPVNWAFRPGGNTYTARGVAQAGTQNNVCIGFDCPGGGGGGGDDTPVAVNDVASLCQGDPPITINVLANDSGLSDTPVVVTLGAVSPAAAGSVSLSGNNAVFTPGGGYTGNASFPYTVTDADGDADTATVAVTVLPPCAGDHTPVAVDDSATVCQASPAVTINAVANDSGLNDTPVSVTVGALAPAGAGSVSLSGTNAAYTPAAAFTGTATFPYTVTDVDGDADTATVTITVGPCRPNYQAMAGIAVGSFLARVNTSGGLLKDVFGKFLNGNVTLVGYTGIAAGSVTLGQLRAALNFGTVNELLTTQITARNFLLAMVTVLQNKGDAPSVQAASDLMNLALAADSNLNMTLGSLVKVAQGAEGSASTVDLNAFQLAMMAAQLANGQNAVDITLTTQNMGGGLAGLLSPLGGNTLRLKVIEPAQIMFGPPGKHDNGQWKTQVKTAQVRAQIHLRPLGTLLGGLLDLPIYLEAASATASLQSITCQSVIND